MKNPYKIPHTIALEKLAASDDEFIQLMKHGTLSIELYKPDKLDKQMPHLQDEIYVIASGHAMFYHEGDITEVKTNDCLFVKAHEEHRFFNFSSDFTTWAFLYGPPGGE